MTDIPAEPTGAREPTEDELIDFMDWLIDHKLPTEQIDMSKISVMEESLDFFSEDKLGEATGIGTLDGADSGGNPPACRWWEGRLYVVDFGDVRVVYSLL